MSVIELFPKPLYIGIETQDNTELYNQITSMTDRPSDVLSNDGGWQSVDKELDLISNIIKRHCKKYFRHLGNGNAECNIVAQWANVNCPGSSNIVHHHGDCDFSGVYYVRVPENSGDLLVHNFEAPNNNLSKVFTNTTHTSTGHRVEPEEGLIVMFPGNLKHSVTTNRSNEDRVSIAFNLDVIH